MAQFTLIWMAPTLDVGCETFDGDTKEDAVRQWEAATYDCTLIGIIAGTPEILVWYP